MQNVVAAICDDDAACDAMDVYLGDIGMKCELRKWRGVDYWGLEERGGCMWELEGLRELFGLSRLSSIVDDQV
jgi:hypothetical protein